MRTRFVTEDGVPCIALDSQKEWCAKWNSLEPAKQRLAKESGLHKAGWAAVEDGGALYFYWPYGDESALTDEERDCVRLYIEQLALFGVREAPTKGESASRELPRYKCHKEVWALKIKAIDKKCTIPAEPDGPCTLFFEEEGYAPIEVSAEWFWKFRPEPGTYLVFYMDGYRSVSPAKAFEEGYTRIL